MIVLDASAAVDWLLQTSAGLRSNSESIRVTKPSTRLISWILRSRRR